MDAASKPSSVSSRFVSQTELSEAQRRREDEVRATYARLGQSPPPEALAAARRENEEYDPRSLFERLQANKDAKQEAFDEKMKLSNQFRGIDDGESEFLAEVAREKRKAERKKEEEMRKELDEFRKWVTERWSKSLASDADHRFFPEQGSPVQGGIATSSSTGSR